jgi:DNA-binding CsgD family transcriptional regulator
MPDIDLPNGTHLTPCELQALRLLLEGLTARQAADALGLKPKTINYHIWHVHKKLGTHNVLQARRRLEELGLLEIVMRETPKEPAAK